MEPLTLRYVADACGGERFGGDDDLVIHRVRTDSREVAAQDLFVALEGERFDGHNFLQEAGARGATGVLARRDKVVVGTGHPACIAVDDTRKALGRLAARYRNDFDIPFIAIAGSNGKTTTKDMLASVLLQRYRTLWSRDSFNNNIGVPRTLLELERSHEVAVLEIGTNHPGELAPLVRMVQPQYGVITSIGPEHLEFFGNIAGVAEEEGWLAELIPAGGTLFVNGAAPEIGRIIERCRANVVTVGWGAASDWKARFLSMDERGVSFEVVGGARDCMGLYELNLLGRHQVLNALLVIAVAHELGLNQEEIRLGLAQCPPPKMRLQASNANGIWILDDTFNANVDSMRAALQTLHEFPCRGRRMAVLGEMAELGAQSLKAHAEVGRQAAAVRLDHLFTVGANAEGIGEAARSAGLAAVHHFSNAEEAAAAVRGFAREGDVVLLKASRAARLERVGERLRQPGPTHPRIFRHAGET